MPACPPIKQSFPIVVDPAIPTWAAIQVLFPTITLCAIWTRLSILTPDLNIVEPRVALSIVQLDQISTSSSIITFPLCITFKLLPFESLLKPNPSEPTTVPE